MSRRHNRARKERRKVRTEAEHEALFAPALPSEDDSPPRPHPRTFSLGVKGGWSMDFVLSGIPVPFDPEAPEPPPLRELTLDAMMAKDDKPTGES